MRIGLAVARALGIAWEARVRGYPTLALVAAMARNAGDGSVTACMTGGHGEWFVQDFTADGSPSGKVISLPPAQAAERPVQSVIAGSKAEELHALLPPGSALSAVRLPDARHALALDLALLRDELAPLYGRPPDAKLPG